MTLGIGIVTSAFDDEGAAFCRDAERLGIDTIWAPEAWMYDAFTPLAYLAAITDRVKLATGCVQLGSRTPALLAMSSFAMQKMSGGRFVLGMGTSGPQVMEGWHGVRFDKPVTRTRETIEIIRMVERGERLSYDGTLHQNPLPDSQGRAMRSPVTGDGPTPIYLASMGPANLALTGAASDGWIGTAFMPETADIFTDPIREGAESAGRSLADIELTVAATLEFTDDPEEAGRRHASGYAFTIGAMGSSKTNFYNQAFTRQGFGDAVEEVQRLWQDGDRDAAAEAVPIEIGFGTNLLGGDTEVTERLRRYRDAGIDEIRVALPGDTAASKLDDLARLMDLVNNVNSEE